MKYKVTIRESEEGFSVSVPGLPGCWSQGATEEEALANIEQAIREYLEVAEELMLGAEVREVEAPTPGLPADARGEVKAQRAGANHLHMLGHPLGPEFHDGALSETPLYLSNGRVKCL